jgi:hypothetical protein
MKELERHFESKVDIPLIRVGKRQKIETLINEEALSRARDDVDDVKDVLIFTLGLIASFSGHTKS